MNAFCHQRHDPHRDRIPPLGPMVIGQPRLVVAEEDLRRRRRLVRTLRRVGYDVSEVTDGRGLLEAIGCLADDAEPASSPDLLVTDARVGRVAGLDAVEMLRRCHQSTPAVVLSAGVNPQERLRARRLDAVLLEGPFDSERLCRSISELLAARAVADDLFDPRETEELEAAWAPVRPKGGEADEFGTTPPVPCRFPIALPRDRDDCFHDGIRHLDGGSPMGDKSPKSKDKQKKQKDAAKAHAKREKQAQAPAEAKPKK